MRPKILVIEDNEQNLYLVTFILEKNGYEVIAAVDGKKGISTAIAEKPDLILLDIQLPVMDGYTVINELKKDPATSVIPVVAVTSFAMPGDREKAMSMGFSGYLEKPINPDTFMSQIKQFLKYSER